MSIGHLLTVPHDQGTRDVLQNKNDLHMIIKATKINEDISIETIQQFPVIESSYLTTRLLENKALCYITSAVLFGLFPGKPACDHISTIRLTITTNLVKCPHGPYGLGAYCHCESKREQFEEIISQKDQKKSTAFQLLPIDLFSSCVVQIILGENSDEVVLQKDITFLDMCKERVQNMYCKSQIPSRPLNFLNIHFEPLAYRMLE